MHTMAAKPTLNRDYERRAYWHATMPPLHDRGGRQLPDIVDVAIVGGGYTGVAAARKLALQGAKAVLLEAETLGWGASTRNGGIAHPGFKWGPRTLTKRYGPVLAKAIYRETIEALELVFGLIRDNDIDAELRPSGWLELAWAPSHFEDFAAEAASLEDFGVHARVVEKERLREEIGTGAYHGGLALDPGGVLHPAKWFAGLVGLAERAGADLHEGTAVRSIRRQADGRFVVETGARRDPRPGRPRRDERLHRRGRAERAPADRPDRQLHHRHRAAARPISPTSCRRPAGPTSTRRTSCPTGTSRPIAG